MSQILEISPLDLSEKISASSALKMNIIDVRRPEEWTGELGHIKGAVLATLETDLETYLDRLPKDQTYTFVCKSGGRSGRATMIALSKGFKNVFNMTGGMIAWNSAGLSIERN